jgi:UDP-N-acetylmuramoylalanine-D-glutamate ligase
MRVLVCGGRDYRDWDRLRAVLDDIPITTMIEGCAQGADSLAERYAALVTIDNEHYPAEWDVFGKAAGPIRNRQMLKFGNPDLVVAFPGDKGTADMVKRARAAGVEVRVIE